MMGELAAKLDNQESPELSSESRKWQWRVDLKWVLGIPFTVLLAATLVVLSLFLVSGREGATRTLAEMDQQALADPQLMAELSTSSPQLAALLADPGFAGIVYDDPAVLDQAVRAAQTGGVTAASEDTAAAGQTGTGGDGQIANNGQTGGLGVMMVPIQLMGAPTHETLGTMLTVLLGMLLLTGVPYILFSHRAGRLLSPAVSLALASWAPFLVLGALNGRAVQWIEDAGAEASGEEGRLQERLASIVHPFADHFFDNVQSTYRGFALAAVVLLLVAAAVFAVLTYRGRGRGEYASSGPASNRGLTAAP